MDTGVEERERGGGVGGGWGGEETMASCVGTTVSQHVEFNIVELIASEGVV